MVAETASHNSSGSAPLKRQLFNKPSWSKPQALTNGNDLFHRSNQTYVDLAAEAERRRKRKLARKERERASQAEAEERAGKRQRVSESEDDEDDDSASDHSPHKSENEEGSTRAEQNKSKNVIRAMSPPKSKDSPISLLKRYEATVAASEIDMDQKQKPSASHIIDLEDEDEDSPIEILKDSATTRATAAKHPVPPVEEDETISDDEFPELARQAREKARHKRLEEDMVLVTPVSPSMSQIDYQQRSQPTSQPTPPLPPPDPVLDILITSNISNTEPLIVKRKLSQRLKDVKLAWAERQQFSQVFTDGVFLTWRGKRIFDHTTCRSLGYKFSPDGRIMASRDSMMDDEGRVHMQVMTREMFEAYKKAKANDVLDRAKDRSQGPIVEEQKQEPQIKIICKAKGFSDFKLIIKPVRILIDLGFTRN